MKKLTNFVLFLFALALLQPLLFAHCEVPCGIYDDQMRFKMIAEHIITVEKAMKQIGELSRESPKNSNQIVRWTVNEEKHAEEIQHIVSQYFLTQRINLPEKDDEKAAKDYQEKLALCHSLLIYAMKTKQTTDLSHVEKLKSLLHDFEHAYFKKKD